MKCSAVQCRDQGRERGVEPWGITWLESTDRLFTRSLARSFVDSRSAALCHFAVGTSIFRRGKAKVRILSLSLLLLSLFSGLSSQA